MIEIMQIYGSEVSENVLPPRKTNIQRASIVRQFRRWNPTFLEHFHFVHGKWEPKLGREGELKRREQMRRQRKVTTDKVTVTGEPSAEEEGVSSTTDSSSL